MAPALVLTQEKAAEAGYSGSGPFAFCGVFPGVYFVDVPVETSALGFADAGEAADAMRASGAPLEMTDVPAGSAPAYRPNHRPGERQTGAFPAPSAAAGRINSHREADDAADELGFAFPTDPRPTLADKIAAIDAIRAGADADEILDDFLGAGG